MQNPKEEPVKVRITLKLHWMFVRFFIRYHKHPEALEPFLDSLRAIGIPKTRLETLRTFLISWYETVNDHAKVYRIDRFLTTGVGAVDLVLLPVVLPMGVPDRPLFLATAFLAISVVLVALSLSVNFVKLEVGITKYGTVHSTVVALAQASGVAALTGTFWHSSAFVGNLFLVLAVPAFLVWASYFTVVNLLAGFFQVQNALTQPAPDANKRTAPDEPEHAQPFVVEGREEEEGESHPSGPASDGHARPPEVPNPS